MIMEKVRERIWNLIEEGKCNINMSKPVKHMLTFI